MSMNLRVARFFVWTAGSREGCPDPVLDLGASGPPMTIVLARFRILVPALALALALLPAVSSAQWNQLGPDLDGEAAYDWSGFSVDLSSHGRRLAVGARQNDNPSGSGAGHVRVFEWDPVSETWTQLGDDIDGEAAGDQSGYSVALSSDGTRLAVGAPGNDDGGTFAGHARVFEWDGGTSSWIQLGADIDGLSSYDNLGCSVALSSDGSRLAVGALGFDGVGTDSGQARVYEWSSGSSSWILVGSAIGGEAAGDQAGLSVALSSDGSRVAIGAPLNDGTAADAGQARVFEWDGGSSSWVQVGSDIDGESGGDYASIVALSADGFRVAVGAYNNSGAGTYAGHVRVFEWLSGPADWVQLGPDIDGEGANDHSGSSVAVSSSGLRVAVGAPSNDNASGGNSGHVRVFDWNDATASWTQVFLDIDGEAADDQSGFSVALTANGSRLAAGAIFNDNPSGDDAGHVRYFSETIFSDGFETGTTGRWSVVTP